MKELKVLHLFNQYLPQTENWCFKLIVNTPNTQVYIGAQEYLKNDFYPPQFQYAENPFGAIHSYNTRLAEKNIPSLIKGAAQKFLRYFRGDIQKNIAGFAQDREVDLIHAHFADVGWYFRNIPQQLEKPFVLSFYGWDYESLPTTKPQYREHYQQLFKRVDAFVCEGKHGAQILIGMGCPKPKVKVVPLGVEVQQIPVMERSKKSGELHLLQIANFHEKKGHLYTLKAFVKALEYCPNMTLSLLGKEGQTEIKKGIVDFVKTHHLEKQIQIYDAIDYTQLYSYLANFQVFIHPSCYAQNRDCEGGAPIVLLDAQATGMPIISTKHCDIPEEVLDGKTGLLAAEKNIAELAQHIQTFYNMDEAEYYQYSQKARAHIVANFDSKKNAKKLRDIYELFG